MTVKRRTHRYEHVVDDASLLIQVGINHREENLRFLELVLFICVYRTASDDGEIENEELIEKKEKVNLTCLCQ